jgi:hypothetical protein
MIRMSQGYTILPPARTYPPVNLQIRRTPMSDKTNWTSICPHCGYASEDSAMCRCCGRLIDEALPMRTFSLARAVFSVVSSLSFETTRDIWKNDDHADFHNAIQKNPVYSFFSGNIFHRNKG